MSENNKDIFAIGEIKEEIEIDNLGDSFHSSLKVNNENNTKGIIYGYGKFEFQNKIIYLGMYKQRPDGVKLRHGKGIILHPKISINSSIKMKEESYEGDWIDDKMEGFGIYTYANGDIYEGEFKNNMHHGYGKYFFCDGSYYTGEWNNHKFHGSGRYNDINNIKWDGEFRNGEYKSKEQARLKEEKRIENKTKQIQAQYKKFLLQWENIISQIQTTNVKGKDGKDNKEKLLEDLFANKINMGQYILPPYTDINQMSIIEWDKIIKFLLKDNVKKVKFNIPANHNSIKIIDKTRVLSIQLQEDLNSGQLIEMSLIGERKGNINNKREKENISSQKSNKNLKILNMELENYNFELVIAHNKEFNKWFIVYFSMKEYL